MGLTTFGWASLVPGTVTSRAMEIKTDAMKQCNLEKIKIFICKLDFIKNYSFKGYLKAKVVYR